MIETDYRETYFTAKIQNGDDVSVQKGAVQDFEIVGELALDALLFAEPAHPRVLVRQRLRAILSEACVVRETANKTTKASQLLQLTAWEASS